VEIATEAGTALAELDGPVRDARVLLALTHGAGGGIGSPDLLAARDAALGLGGLVVRVVQPYRVRGARAPGSAVRQDAAWREIIVALRELEPSVPLVQGGRSNGARVACRTAAEVGAQAVVALAFPLHPPASARPSAQPSAGRDQKSRADELREPRNAGIPVLVINGERDPFGIPDENYQDRLVVVPGEAHALKGHASVIRTAVTQWLPSVLPGLATTRGTRRRGAARCGQAAGT
jgi:predicted alpha/beta-hydrolase family hydrolase